MRLHLTPGQRAMSTARVLVEGGYRRNGRWVRGTVETNGLDNAKSVTKRGRPWQVAMVKAGAILDHAPDLAEDVAEGRLSLDAAYQRAEENRAAAERVAVLDPDLAVLVKAGSISLSEAERRIRDGERLEQLPADLVQRVEDGNVSLDEAEVLHKQEQDRLKVQADEIHALVDSAARLVGAPISDGLAELVGKPRTRGLQLMLDALGQEDFADDLRRIIGE